MKMVIQSLLFKGHFIYFFKLILLNTSVDNTSLTINQMLEGTFSSQLI